jgi:hypothetical protein
MEHRGDPARGGAAYPDRRDEEMPPVGLSDAPPPVRCETGGEKPMMDAQGDAEIPLVSKDEAIAEVRRWLEVEKIDPERIFTATGDQVVRYKDLVVHLERETPDGQLLRFAISRGRVMASERRQAQQALFQIVSAAKKPSGGGTPPAPADPEDTATPA